MKGLWISSNTEKELGEIPNLNVVHKHIPLIDLSTKSVEKSLVANEEAIKETIQENPNAAIVISNAPIVKTVYSYLDTNITNIFVIFCGPASKSQNKSWAQEAMSTQPLPLIHVETKSLESYLEGVMDMVHYTTKISGQPFASVDSYAE
ncbi:MAG: hypothetical protein LN588_04920 [Rickettsia endosymbiont of Bryobia graminum]|nr:hypothetical protein [Rickettsia endosymbiont of Bryobia graminum]